MTSQHHRSSLIFLVLFLFLGFYPVPIQASDCPYSIHVEAEPSSAKPGDEVRLSCSLAGYENPDSPDLMGVQVNINSITEEMKPSSLKSLIVSGQHLSNRASFNKKNQSVVLLYMSDRFADDESQIQYLSRSQPVWWKESFRFLLCRLAREKLFCQSASYSSTKATERIP